MVTYFRGMTTTAAVRTARTGPLLAGIVAGPLFLAVVVLQMAAHDGFDPARHPLSSLALGPHGWIQTVNFLVTGALILIFAAGLRRHLGGARWRPLLIAVNGLAMIVAAAFPADPINGYPAGAADQVSLHGIVHSAGPAAAGIAGIIAYVLFARTGSRGWRVYTWVTLALTVALTVAAASMMDFRIMLLAAAVQWGWLTVLAVRAYRVRAIT
jgi:hypothetical protein